MASLRHGGLAEPGALPLAEQPTLPHPDVEVIPRERLRHVAEASVDARVTRPLPEGAAPIAVEIRRRPDEVGESAIPAGEEGLKTGFPGVLVHDANRPAPRPTLDDLELVLEAPHVVERRPLKRRPRLRYERGHRERELAERMAVGSRHAEALEHPFGEGGDGCHVLNGLRGQSDHEITLE